MIIEKIGLDNLKRLAKPRYVDASHPDFKEAVDVFVTNCMRTEKRRHGLRTESDIRKHCVRGLVAEFALKKVKGIEENCPLVPDLKMLDKTQMKTDQTFYGHRLQVKSRPNIGSKYWTINQNQMNSIRSSMYENDFFVLVGVREETKNTWLAVPEAIIPAFKLYDGFQKSQYNDWAYYFDLHKPRHNKGIVLLTNLLKPDSIEEMKECA